MHGRLLRPNISRTSSKLRHSNGRRSCCREYNNSLHDKEPLQLMWRYKQDRKLDGEEDEVGYHLLCRYTSRRR